MRPPSAKCWFGWAALLALLWLPACATRQSSRQADPPPQPYVRVLGANANSNRVELQIASKQFLPDRRKGPAVWLVGVSHVGEPQYYRAIQRELDASSLVLFEGISGLADEDEKPAPRTAARQGGGLQDTLADSLGLVFQLNEIQYTRRIFRNSDLSVVELQELMARQATNAPVGGAGVQTLQSLLDLMQGNSFMSTVFQAVLKFMGSSPKLQGFGRLALIELIDQIQGDPDKLSAQIPELKELMRVLVQERNKRVLSDLREWRHDVPRSGSLAIFYGTAHMPDMERRLRELGYHPAGELWFTAFAVDLKKCGISAGERQFLSRLIATQLRASEPGKTP